MIIVTAVATAEFWTAAGTWAMVLVLAITLYFVYRQVQAANELRRIQTRPFVVVSIDIEQQMLFMLTVQNVGNSPAYDVEMLFDPPVEESMMDGDDLLLLKEPTPMIPPKRTLRAAWESSIRVLADDYPHPRTYRVAVTYRDHDGQKYGPETYVLDFNSYRGQAAGLKGLPELVKAVEKLQKEHAKWTDGIKGLRVNAVDADKQERRRVRPIHLARGRKAYREKGPREAVRYWIDLLRHRYGLRIR